MNNDKNYWLIKTNKAKIFIDSEYIELDVEINLMNYINDEISNLKYINEKCSNFRYLQNEYRKMDIKFKENVAKKLQEINVSTNYINKLEPDALKMLVKSLDNLKDEAFKLREKMRDFDKFEKYENLKDIVKSALFYMSEPTLNFLTDDIYTFVYKMNINDIVIIPTRTKNEFVIGKITDIYEYIVINDTSKHIRKVKWVNETIDLPFYSNYMDTKNRIILINDNVKNIIVKAIE